MKIKSGTSTDMMRYVCGMVMTTLLFVDVQSGWSQQQYLYSPVAVAAEGTTQSKDGVLVQEVTVQRGDTLSRISRRFSGHGTYYPQILLFNDIKDPNKIYPGNIFKVPVAQNRMPRSLPEVSTPDLENAAASKVMKRAASEKSAEKTNQQVITKKQRVALAADTTGGQKLFERAVEAYRRDDCRAALESFDLFLAKNQSSPLAADASLYKADCYLRLSNQN